MSRYHSHINTALKLLQSYRGDLPFSIFIKQFFSKEKKYGSKDRKQIAALCYSYFRMGLAFNKQLSEENLLRSFFLTNSGYPSLIAVLKPEWSGAVDMGLDEKIKLAAPDLAINSIFPFANELNGQTDVTAFNRSFFFQPHLFVRIRPQHQHTVPGKLSTAGIAFRLLRPNCIELAAATNIEQVLKIDEEIVIQDRNSQLVLNYLIEHSESIPLLKEKEIAVWDCCAASGGKSILITDILEQHLQLTVSDIRPGSIANLQQRFKNAGIKKYHSFVADTSDPAAQLPGDLFDLIICDAPCTGSGTWSRTPEQLYFFNPDQVDVYAARQKKIAANSITRLKKDGLLFYITCSVFKKENEEVAAFIALQPGMQLLEMKNLEGYTMQADSMFVAVFKKTA